MEPMFSNGMCRCCASEGTYKDLSSKYRWMGVDEVYADMLRECFDVTLVTPEDSTEGGICEVCITQLRNAANFKKQVLNTEEQFKRVLQNKPYKSDIVKVEVSPPDDELRLTDEDNNLSNDDFSSTEYEVPIKTESSEEGGKSRKRSAKAGPSRSKHAKLEGETSSKRHPYIHTEIYQKDKTDRILKEIEEEILKDMRLKYAIRLLQCTTMLPFKTSPGFKCFYCDAGFMTMEMLKNHTMINHTNPNEDDIEDAIGKIKRKYPFVSVNVVELECKMCDHALTHFQELEDHLSSEHGVEIPDTKFPVVVPFKIANKKCVCALCGKCYKGFNSLSNHMNDHYPCYECDICGAGFLGPDRLKQHRTSHSAICIESNEKVAPEEELLNVKQLSKRVVLRKPISSVVKSKSERASRVKLRKEMTGAETDPFVNSAVEEKYIRAKKIDEAVLLIQNSSILPFKTGTVFTCFYCKSNYGVIEELQEHNDEKHPKPDKESIRRVLSKLKSNQIGKVNVANINCKLCDDAIKDFEDLKKHLSKKHGMKFTMAENDMIIPFKIANGVFECVLCGDRHSGYKSMTMHMNTHYRNHICEQCGVGFLTTARLKAHSHTHLTHSHPCEVCNRAFKSRGAMSQHRRYVHNRQQNNRCPHCSEMFHDYYARQKHITIAHRNVVVKMHGCEFCTSSFLVKGHLYNHVRDVHKKERSHECTECDKKFFHVGKLEEHIMSRHIGVRFECSFCARSYAAKKTLRDHIKKAHPDCTYMCEHCGKSFAVKDVLEKHIKTKHGDLVSSTCVIVGSAKD